MGVLHWDECQLLFPCEISLTGSCVWTLGAQRVVLLEKWWNLQQVKPSCGKGVTEGKEVWSPAPFPIPISLSFLYQTVNKTPQVPATVKDHSSPARKNNGEQLWAKTNQLPAGYLIAMAGKVVKQHLHVSWRLFEDSISQPLDATAVHSGPLDSSPLSMDRKGSAQNNGCRTFLRSFRKKRQKSIQKTDKLEI